VETTLVSTITTTIKDCWDIDYVHVPPNDKEGLKPAGSILIPDRYRASGSGQ